ncbi:hypothetical protein GOV11_04895, partial [Candidatus Woesearchaeota archaeon]|nr:hypothetical protein [Candidatus Woesearchaeota archaeon]
DHNQLLSELEAAEKELEERDIIGEFVEFQMVDLVPGEYEIDGLLLYYGLVEIPEMEKCAKALGGIIKKCYTIPEKNFTSWMSGGVLFTKPDTIKFSEDFVYSDASLTIFLLEQPLPTNWDDVTNQQTVEEYMSYGKGDAAIPLCGSRRC